MVQGRVEGSPRGRSSTRWTDTTECYHNAINRSLEDDCKSRSDRFPFSIGTYKNFTERSYSYLESELSGSVVCNATCDTLVESHIQATSSMTGDVATNTALLYSKVKTPRGTNMKFLTTDTFMPSMTRKNGLSLPRNLLAIAKYLSTQFVVTWSLH